jgi:glycosyltransferase involved in cell wall biosynthesis
MAMGEIADVGDVGEAVMPVTRKLRVVDVINTDWSARELLDHRVRQANESGRFENEILCAVSDHAEGLRASGHTVHPVGVPRDASLLGILRAIAAARRIFRQRRVDVVHVHGTTAWVVGAVAARLARVPLVVAQVHGFHHHDNMRPAVLRAVLLCERLLCALAHRLLYQNPADIEECRRRRLAPDHKNRLIGNGVQLGDFPVTDPPDNDPPRILCVSRLEPVKNLPLLIDAARILRDRGRSFLVQIVGQGDLRPQLEARVASHGLGDVVRFLGYRTDVPRLTADSDVCVLTSLKEGLPRAIIEAGACARPIVATDVIGSRDAVVDGETGFLVPLGDAEALADRVEQLLTDPTLRHRMGRASRVHAEANFDERCVTDRILDVYDDARSRSE